jgi:DNA polymerase-3 subunit delta'
MFDPAIQGHLAIRQRLWERVQSVRLSGSLLFTGPDGIGKRRVALELAQRELCFRRSACGHCEGCKPFKAEPLPVELPNLLRIAPEGKAGLIRIGAIREDDLVEGGVIRWAHQASLSGTHRWILVEDAHRLNGASANMLLKTLEEPPPGTHFLLVTHRAEAMLQTIRSRCERIPLKALDSEEAWRVALAAGWGAEDQERWTSLSAGTLRYLDPADFALAVARVEAWLALSAGASFAAAAQPLLPEKNSTLAQSEQMAQSLELLLRILGDAGRLRSGRKPGLWSWREGLEGLARSALDFKRPVEAIHEAQRHLVRNPFAESLLREIALALRG